jgi:hypothetical protein
MLMTLLGHVLLFVLTQQFLEHIQITPLENVCQYVIRQHFIIQKIQLVIV